jgi:hypothetical protein
MFNEQCQFGYSLRIIDLDLNSGCPSWVHEGTLTTKMKLTEVYRRARH